MTDLREQEASCTGAHNASLTQLARKQAASRRIAETQTREEHLEALREIAANLIGCEQVAVYKLESATDSYTLLWQFGLEPQPSKRLCIAQENHLTHASKGVIVANGITDENPTLSGKPVEAIVPVRLRGGAEGVAVLYVLLPQKSALDDTDMEVFKVLSV